MRESVPPEEGRKELASELAEFLVEFSIGVHRYGMYPSSHPALGPAASNIVRRLERLLETRISVAIGVAQRRLVVDGVLTEDGHPVFSDLARRLSDHQLGAVSFGRGITTEEIAGILRVLAEEVGRGGQPIGAGASDETPRWANIDLHPAGYEKLELREDADGEVGTGLAISLWLSLAEAVLDSDRSVAEVATAGTLARSIQSRVDDTEYDEAVIGYLLQLAAELKGRKGGEANKIRQSVSQLLAEMDQETLTRLLSFGGDFAQRSRFLLDANQDMEADSVVKLLHAAATSSEQTISNSMTRVLTKMAAHASWSAGAAHDTADEGLREHVEALVNDWELEDPNPESYTNTLDAMAQAGPVLQLQEEEGNARSGAARILEMALELDTFGPIVSKAVSDLLEQGDADLLVARLEDAPEAPRTVRETLSELLPQDRLGQLLAGGHLTESMLRTLVNLMEEGGADTLFAVLTESEQRSVRQHVFDVLAEMGPEVVDRALARLDDPRWFVQRNILALLQGLGELPEDFDPFPFLGHEDARVRIEALRLALRNQDRRTRTLVTALADADPTLVRTALFTLHRDLPSGAVPTLVHRVVSNENLPEDLRVLAIGLAAKTGSPLALDALLQIATVGKTFWGRPKLAAASPMVLHALSALARFWPAERAVRKVLDVAARSKDLDIRGAVRETSPQDPPSRTEGS